MLDPHEVIDVLAALEHVEAVEDRLAAFAVELAEEVVAHERAAEVERMAAERRDAVLLEVQRVEVERGGAFFLHAVVIDVGVGADDDLGDGGC